MFFLRISVSHVLYLLYSKILRSLSFEGLILVFKKSYQITLQQNFPVRTQGFSKGLISYSVWNFDQSGCV